MAHSRRTPEQLAAYHQAKANQARAKAKNAARAADARRKIVLGGALLARAQTEKDVLEGKHTADQWLRLVLDNYVAEKDKDLAFASVRPSRPKEPPQSAMPPRPPNTVRKSSAAPDPSIKNSEV